MFLFILHPDNENYILEEIFSMDKYIDNIFECCDGNSSAGFYFTSNAGSRDVYAQSYKGYSDRRLKDKIVNIESDKCLEYIDKLKIYNFDFIDNNHGQNNSIGFMADDVKEIMSTLVNENKGYLPNIYEGVEDVDSLGDKIYGIKLNKVNNDIKVNDKIKIIDKTNSNQYFGKITEIIESYIKVRIDENINNSNSLFIYGSEVDDVKTVNYNSIFSMSIGSIKELNKENQKLKQEIHVLKDRLENIENLLRK